MLGALLFKLLKYSWFFAAMGFLLCGAVMVWAGSQNPMTRGHEDLYSDFSQAFFMCLGWILGGFLTAVGQGMSESK